MELCKFLFNLNSQHAWIGPFPNIRRSIWCCCWFPVHFAVACAVAHFVVAWGAEAHFVAAGFVHAEQQSAGSAMHFVASEESDEQWQCAIHELGP